MGGSLQAGFAPNKRCAIDPVTFQSDGPTKPTGTGPFTFAEYAQGDHFTLKKNPNYWQSGRPYLDGIEIKIFSDPQSMITQLEAGTLDLVLAPPIRDVDRLSKDPKFAVTFHQYSGGANLIFVQAKDGAGPTTNKLFRQALNAAIDRKRWSDAVLLGYGAPKTLPLAPPNPGYDQSRDQALSFDLDKAKSLLVQSGVGSPSLEVIWNTTISDYSTVMQVSAVTGCVGSPTACSTKRMRRDKSRFTPIGWATSRTKAGRCRGRIPRRGSSTRPGCTESVGILPTT